MGTVIRPDRWRRGVDGARPRLRSGRWIMAAAVLAPVAAAAALIPGRGRLDSADDALILVVVIVAVASTGRRTAAAVAALMSSLSFDFFLTRPYNSLRISRHADLTTEVLLLVVGLAVGELAARGRRYRDAAGEGRHQLDLLHSVTEMTASGQEPEAVVAAACRELDELLALRDCRYTSHEPGGVTARVTPAGDVAVGSELWSTEDLGLPTHTVDLPVRGGGWLLGHFLLTPTPGRPVSHERLQVAVTIANQVGSAMVGEDPGSTHPDRPWRAGNLQDERSR